ncbi:MAG TPA: RraA family protein [Bryobacteraceae bacterium]|nr:RraA family protein [Bryobacteraceae bacterium]
MTPIPTLAPGDFEKIRGLDTCTVSNAIECFNVRLRNEGFIHGNIRCMFPHLPPMLGYAVTARIRTSAPPMAGLMYYDRMDWWNYLTTIPAPRIMVLQDADRSPGVGACMGEIHAQIALALDCVGCITNGVVRDLPAVREAGFHLFAAGVVVSHSYAHIADFGEPVEIDGLKISPGDLLHGDLHGIHTVPVSIAPEIPRMASNILARERALIDFCRSSSFSLDKLVHAIGRCISEKSSDKTL